MPDADLLDARLESLRRCLRRIQEKTPPSAPALIRDYDAQDIVSVNLQRAVQICVDLGSHLIASRGWPAPSTMADTFVVLSTRQVLDPGLAERLQRAVGFRNVAVHEYDAIDWERVFRLVQTSLDDFRSFAAAIVNAWNPRQADSV
ncbi:MAG: DUF86 domain-containing protein [Spirochaetaceae bacterium]|nr:MAG: DUF86 domain-containing protein [Spirochaetaceae bacterium]